MIDEGKFGPAEATSLVTITIAAKVFFTSAATVATVLGTSGWYMTIISASTAMLGFFFIYRLLKRFPENDLEEIFEISFGKVFGFLCSGILSLYLLLTAITRLAEFTEVMRVYVLHLSPNWYISGFFIASVFFMSRLGLENVARLAKIFAFPMLIALSFVLLMAVQNFKISNLYPILGYGLKKTILTGFVRSSVYGEIIVLAIFAKSLQGVKHIKKVGFNSLLLSGLLIAGSVLAFTLTYPYFISRDITAPMFEMASLVDYGKFLQRMESVFLFVWIISTLISTITVFYAFLFMYCRMFKIHDKNPIILGGCLILFAGSQMHMDIASIIVGNVENLRKYGSLVFFVLPLVALVVATIRKKSGLNNA